MLLSGNIRASFCRPTTIFLVAAGIFAVVRTCIPDAEYQQKSVRIQNVGGRPLWVVMLSPVLPSQGRAPAAILCQPLNNPPEFARSLALELVREGFVTLTFDWSGRSHAENRRILRSDLQTTLHEDALGAFAYLKTRADVGPDRIVIAGHSVGGTIAIDAAIAEPSLAATACIGMEAEVPYDLPRNLLWAVGVYDEFRSPRRMRATFESSVPEFSRKAEPVGDFLKGTARGLVISPTADHFTELFDWRLQRDVVNWFCNSVGIAPQHRAYWAELRDILHTLTWFSALAAGLAGTRALLNERRRWLRIVPLFALIGLFALSNVRGAYHLLAADTALYLTVFGLLSGFIASATQERLTTGLKRVLRNCALVYISLLLTLLVNAVPEYLRRPECLLYVPEFAVRYLLDWLYAYVLTYPRQMLFSAYGPDGLSLRLWVFGVIIIELANPGVLARLVASAWRRLGERKPVARRISTSHLAVLAVLLLALACVGWLRLRQGFITTESARAALIFVLRFSFMPIGFFILFRRVVFRN